MQVVIALPPVADMGRLEGRVAGVPLLVRVMATALRGGGSRILLVLPPACRRERLAALLASRPVASARIDTIETARTFDPARAEDWRAIGHLLDDRFLWMPCDYLAHKQTLAGLVATAGAHPGAAVRFSGVLESGPGRRMFDRPAVLLKGEQTGGAAGRFEAATTAGWRGMSMRPPARVSDAEAELVRGSGKPTDGIYSRFNRRLCRPAVRWLSHTSATPNAVTFAGLAVAVLAGLCFAQGTWLWGVAGAALFFVSGLLDEIDGMLARLTFQESPFGCWLETFVDYATYLLIFAGMTAGGYRTGGGPWLAVGTALLAGCVVSFIVISIQRKLAAPANRPHEYNQRYLAALDRDAANPVSRAVRQLQFLTKKGVLVHYLLLFAVLNLLPAVLLLAAFGANVAWAVTLYFNRRLFASPKLSNQGLAAKPAVAGEVEK